MVGKEAGRGKIEKTRKGKKSERKGEGGGHKERMKRMLKGRESR